MDVGHCTCTECMRNLYTVYHPKTVPYTPVNPVIQNTRNTSQPSNNIVGHDRQNHGAGLEFKW